MVAEQDQPHSAIDWTEQLDAEVANVLQSLPFQRLHRVPLPKHRGLPLGREGRILKRWLFTGGTSSLDPSGLWRVYRALLREDERLCYDGLVLREELPAERWRDLLGSATDSWRQRGLLEETGDAMRCRFVVVPVKGTPTAEPFLLTSDPFYHWFHNRVHIGQDSLTLLEFLLTRRLKPMGSLLDVGTGSGVLLLSLARLAESALGVDINPRAVRAASFNAKLSGASGCSVEDCDILVPSVDLGTFDMVLWNAPLRFLPEKERESNIDGDGGELGIAVTLDFLARLPELLTERGTAYVMSAAPILTGGENRLETELRAQCARLGIDVVAHAVQLFWDPARRAFLEQFGIRCFETVVLEVRRGAGSYEPRPRSVAQRMMDGMRGAAYSLRSS